MIKRVLCFLQDDEELKKYFKKRDYIVDDENPHPGKFIFQLNNVDRSI